MILRDSCRLASSTVLSGLHCLVGLLILGEPSSLMETSDPIVDTPDVVLQSGHRAIWSEDTQAGLGNV